ncbi:uncharacterized protein DUF2851 [Maribacter vaceletii]|uniref:Uncharacterized protein DUF2851 n=1 Tax=Maribacter vaceletii TaxID=1206816 RepID=A0A495DSA9_9FLAO|nr:DUF2851 family protein [Maribacter vaceletii]RKR07039.1 uncharacterized protein DUF2851 [Maribacter vaceletii]
MQEDLLHFVWKHKKIPTTNLKTTDGVPVTVVKIGQHNHKEGPDFFNAQVRVGEQLWVGNVEIHLKSSDWYAHNHEVDDNYNSVILHVVWEDDVSVFRNDNSKIPTLELKTYIEEKLLINYENIFNATDAKFINCEKDINGVDDFVVNNWLERLFFERLEQKTEVIKELLKKSNNDWEYVLFIMLLKSFGLKINGDSFFSLQKSLNASTVSKLKNNDFQLESVLYGLLGLLEKKDCVDVYYIKLKKEYEFLKNKLELSEVGIEKPHFFKLRPPNFPTIRLSQFASMYGEHQNLFSKLISETSLEDLYTIFTVSASEYWDTHYSFGKESKKSKKKITKKFIDLIVINTIIPFKFYYAKSLRKDVNEELLNIISKIDTEDNSRINNFKKRGVTVPSAKDSQALLQLYNGYCTKNKCLQCAIGVNLLKGNT